MVSQTAKSKVQLIMTPSPIAEIILIIINNNNAIITVTTAMKAIQPME